MTGPVPLGHLAAQFIGAAGDSWPGYLDVIERAITNHPRSQQATLGPSELGTGCTRCLTMLLAGRKPTEPEVPWLPTVGTAVHSWIEEAFLAENTRLGWDRYLVELTVTVGTLRGQPITGHVDLYDRATGEVTDWKCVGVTTAKKVRRSGTSGTYNAQRHLYGKGIADRGLPVTNVRNVYLPRNDRSLRGAVLVDTQPYDETIAVAALERANMLAAGIDSAGIDAVLEVAGPHTGDEFTCTKWGDGNAPTHAVTARQLDGLLTPDPNPVGSNAA